MRGLGIGIALVLSVGTGCATPPPPIAPAIDAVSVPIEVYHNRVYLPARIDGRAQVILVFDNGASVSGLQDSVARALGIKPAGRATLTGNGQSAMSVGLANDVTFDVASTAIREPLVAILPYADFARHEGRPNGGVLGKDVFARFIVDVDYAAHRLTLRDPDRFTYPPSGIVIPLHVRKDATAAWMAARITLPGHAPLEARLALDMGTYSALRLYSPFVKSRHVLGDVAKTVSTYGFGLGGEFPVRLARVQSLDIGGAHLEEPVAELSLADAGATARHDVDGTIGGAILRRFRVIVDYPHAQMILVPNAELATPFTADMSGLVLEAGGVRLATLTVSHVLDGTAAAEAGFEVEDRLVSIDGVSTETLGLERVQALLSRQAAYHVAITRGDSTRNLLLRTRPII